MDEIVILQHQNEILNQKIVNTNDSLQSLISEFTKVKRENDILSWYCYLMNFYWKIKCRQIETQQNQSKRKFQSEDSETEPSKNMGKREKFNSDFFLKKSNSLIQESLCIKKDFT